MDAVEESERLAPVAVALVGGQWVQRPAGASLVGAAVDMALDEVAGVDQLGVRRGLDEPGEHVSERRAVTALGRRGEPEHQCRAVGGRERRPVGRPKRVVVRLVKQRLLILRLGREIQKRGERLGWIVPFEPCDSETICGVSGCVRPVE